MTEPDPLADLTAAVEQFHGCKAEPEEAVRVVEMFRGKVIWEGTVQVYKLTGCPQGERAFAWSVDTPEKRLYISLLEQGGIHSAQDAVRIAIAAEVESDSMDGQ